MIKGCDLRDACITYRAEKGLSMEQFARLVGVSTITIFNIENGKHKPLATTVAKIIKIINE